MNQSTESPASVTYSITSKDGFNILFTVRDDKVNDLLDKMSFIEPILLKRGYIPQIKKTFGGGAKPIEYVKDEVCPKCGKQLVVVNNEKIESKCSDNKWNPVTKQSEGCTFVKWKN